MENKELEVLKAWETIKNNYLLHNSLIGNEVEIVETTLKKQEQQNNIINIIKGTIKFDTQEPKMEVKENGEISLLSRVGMNIRKQLNEKEKELLRTWVLKECFPKELKALEIIKKKGLSINDIAFIKNGESWETYVETMKELYWGDERLDKVLKTQEEYKLLKEVLL